MMQSRVKKWGNSQGLRLSQELLRLANLAVGDPVDISIDDDRIVITKLAAPRVKLSDLLARMPKDYRPHEVDSGPPVGLEEW